MKRKKTGIPKTKMESRLHLYLVTLVFGVLSVAEAVGGYFPPAIEIAIYVTAAVSLAVTCFCLAGDLKTCR